jgi:hypothetical protein
MTDFLTELLRRSRGQALGLAPRLPSLYEPAGAEALQPAAEEPVPRPLAAEPAPSADPRPAPAELGDLPPPPARDAVLRHRERIPARSRNDDELQRRPIVQTEVPPSEPVEEIEHRLVVEALALPAEPVAGSPGPARREVAAVPLPVAPAAAREHVGEDRVLGDRPREEPPPPDEPRRPRLGTLSEPTRPGTLAVASRRSEPPPKPAGGSTPPSAPTVHVTIGRVEIRAVTAPAPPARRPPSVRTTSLDEYLSERNRRRQP